MAPFTIDQEPPVNLGGLPFLLVSIFTKQGVYISMGTSIHHYPNKLKTKLSPVSPTIYTIFWYKTPDNLFSLPDEFPP